jgi:mono/diheme cytochrome c family protein
MNKLKLAVLGTIGIAAAVAGQTLTANAQAEPDPALLAALIAEGDDVFHHVGCSSCHGNDGEGGIGPTLAGNEVLSSRTAVVSQILAPDEEHGQMPNFAHLSDREIAAVATYVRNAWGNAFGIVPEDTVARLRANMGGGD